MADVELHWRSLLDGDGRAFEAASYVRPGYNCGPGGAHCQHERKGDHGKHCDEWHYVVRRERAALVLQVQTAAMNGVPDLSFRRIIGASFQGNDLTMHVEFLVDVDSLRSDSALTVCEFTQSGRCCCPYTTGLGARELVDVLSARGHAFRSDPGPGDMIWAALIARFDEWYARALAANAEVERHARCPTCNGTGIVERASDGN